MENSKTLPPAARQRVTDFTDLDAWKYACALRNHLTTALDAGYIPKERYEELEAMAIGAIRLANGYMRATKTLKSSTDIRRGQ